MVIINENMTKLPATLNCSDFLLDMRTVNVGPQLVQVGERKFALGTTNGVLAMAFKLSILAKVFWHTGQEKWFSLGK